MGKKKEEKEELAADFFGDDWMDDDEEEEEDNEEEEGGHLPVAPSPETTAEAPKPQDPAGWESKISDAPLDPGALSNAPTLHFSAVPTIPPFEEKDTDVAESIEDMPTMSNNPPPGDVDTAKPAAEIEENELKAPAVDAPVPVAPPPPPPSAAVTVAPSSPPEAEAPAPAEPALAATTGAPAPESAPQPESADDEDDDAPDADPGTEAPEFFGDQLPGEEPLVRTQDPAPSRSPEARREDPAPSFSPPPDPIEKWEPRGDEASWRDVAEALDRAVGHAKEDKASLQRSAARVLARHLGDFDGAESRLRTAIVQSPDDLGLHVKLASVLRSARKSGDAVAYLERAGDLAEGETAAELHLQALEICRDTDPARALDLARKATTAAPRDYAAWSALRDLLGETGAPSEARIAAAEQLAALSSGWAAAEALLEAAGALLSEERVVDAVRLLHEARAAAPDHGTVFVVLEDALGDLGDHAALAELYTSEAAREGTRDAGWWWMAAGRAWRDAGDLDQADAAFGQAVDAGFMGAERERQASALSGERWQALAASLERDAAGEGPGRAFALYRLGQVRERRLSDADGALEAYRAAVEADPDAGPAADGVARLLAAQGKVEDLRALWSRRLDRASEAERPAVSLRLGEASEATGDQQAASTHFTKALAAGSRAVELAAAEGVARVLHRAGGWSELAEHWTRQATGSDDASEKADLLYRAATVGARFEQDHAAAADRLREVLALEPTHAGALFELCMRLEALDDWKGLGQALQDAGDASSDPTRRAVLLYRSAIVRSERRVDLDRVRPCLEGSVAADGAFLPAVWALRDAAGSDARAQLTLYRGQAEAEPGSAGAQWASFAASLLDEAGGRSDLRAILDRVPDHPGALAVMECTALAQQDRVALMDIWEGALVGSTTNAKARLSVRLAALLRDIGKIEQASHVLAELAAQDGARPLRAAARVAESIGSWDVTASLLAGLDAREDRLQRARVIGRRKGDAAAALPLYKALLDEFEADADVAFGTAITAARAGDFETLALAHECMARVAATEEARAASARWAATLHRMGDRHADSLACWRLDLELRPGSTQAFEGAERELKHLGDADGIVELYAAHRTDHPVGLADSLLAVGAPALAVRALRADGPCADPKLAIELYLQQALFASEDWQGAYDQLTTRRESTDDAAIQRDIDARRRWILAEKLAETDAAWDLYRKLHDDAPTDREVTEALARIAGARGETGMAIQYLKELADSADGKDEAARYQRRVGEVYERNGDLASARQAYLDALDHDNRDREALDGLRRLARQEEDWSGLIQVHQREVGIAEPERAIELKREIARVTEDKLGEPPVAMDAWRSVLEVVPGDREALERLMALSESGEEWGSFVEFGTQLAEVATGNERSGLLRRVGVACQEQLQRDDAIRYFEQAISSATPDVEAASRLEELYRARGDWGGTIRALMVQADVALTGPEKAAPLERAARLELEVRHDRGAAAEYYQRVLDADPSNEVALRFMASHLFQTKRFDLARSVCDRLEPVVEEGQDLDDFDTRMDLASFYFAYAEMLLEEADEVGALRRYERALELNPSHQASLERVGPLYTEQGEWKKAEAVYRKLLQLTGGQGDKEKIAGIYAQLGVVERQLENFEKAYKRFNKALELHPNHVGALKGMALVLEDKKDWSNLLNVFNNIIYHATVPGDVVAAYMSKGRILDEHMSRPDKAAQHYQRSLDFDAKQPRALLRMAELAMRRDAYGEASGFAERALKLPDDLVEPFRPLLNLVLAAGLSHAGRTDDAEARVGDAKIEGGADLSKALGPKPLEDLDRLRRLIAERL